MSDESSQNNVSAGKISGYLKLTKLHRGVLVNFNTDSINDSIWLKVNGFDSDVMLSNDKQEKIESD